MRILWPVLTTTRSWLVTLLSLDLLASVSAIKCLQCTSLRHRECESGDMEATQCADVRARYCIKYTGDSDRFVFRSCSKVEKKECELKEVVPGMRMHVCFHTCYTDGCNAATTARPAPTVILLVVVAIFSVALMTVPTSWPIRPI